MKEAITKLIKVKSIISIITTIVFAILSLKGIITGAEFLTVFATIIGFYFGTQANKE